MSPRHSGTRGPAGAWSLHRGGGPRWAVLVLVLVMVMVAHLALGWALLQARAPALTPPPPGAAVTAWLLLNAEAPQTLQPLPRLPAPALRAPQAPPITPPALRVLEAPSPPARRVEPGTTSRTAAPAQTAAPSSRAAEAGTDADVDNTPAAAAADARTTLAQAPVAKPTASQRRPADHRHCQRAPYPAALRERGIQGELRLRVHVDPDGQAAEVKLVASSGWRLFDEAALAQARGCRFRPARQGETEVADWVEYPVRFSLDG